MSAKRAAGILRRRVVAGGVAFVGRRPHASDAGRACACGAVESRTARTALAAEVQAQTLRLKNRLAAAPTPHEPFRNPFAFSLAHRARAQGTRATRG